MTRQMKVEGNLRHSKDKEPGWVGLDTLRRDRNIQNKIDLGKCISNRIRSAIFARGGSFTSSLKKNERASKPIKKPCVQSHPPAAPLKITYPNKGGLVPRGLGPWAPRWGSFRLDEGLSSLIRSWNSKRESAWYTDSTQTLPLHTQTDRASALQGRIRRGIKSLHA